MKKKLCGIQFLIPTGLTCNSQQSKHASSRSVLLFISHFGIAACLLRTVQQNYNDVYTPLPLFPLFSGTHLVKPGAADRTAGLLMITFSRCPIVLYPLTFPSEESSRWTAAAPSQMPFLHLLMPHQTTLAKQAHAQKEGNKCCFLLHFTIGCFLFEVRRYFLEEAGCKGYNSEC